MEVMKFMLESGAFTILFWLFIIFVFFGLLAWGVWIFVKNKFIFKYNFAIINHFGKITKTKARMVRNNAGVTKFQIKGYEKVLIDIRDPNAEIDGLPYRIVTFDGLGWLNYTGDLKDKGNMNSKLVTFKVDKKKYLETTLLPVERESLANNIIDATRKHGKMPTEIKWAYAFAFVLLIVTIAGIFVQGKLLAKQYDTGKNIASQQNQMVNAIERSAEAIKANTDTQLIILNRIYGNSTVIEKTAE